MKDYKAKFKIIMELMEFSKRAFLCKLKKKKPHLTEEKVAAELRAWYRDRPGAKYGDSDGVPGDPSRFNK